MEISPLPWRSLYAGQLDEMSVQLGHHFHEAGEYGRALPYFGVAAERAARLYASEEAITHYTQAIELAGRVSLRCRLTGVSPSWPRPGL